MILHLKDGRIIEYPRSVNHKKDVNKHWHEARTMEDSYCYARKYAPNTNVVSRHSVKSNKQKNRRDKGPKSRHFGNAKVINTNYRWINAPK